MARYDGADIKRLLILSTVTSFGLQAFISATPENVEAALYASVGSLATFWYLLGEGSVLSRFPLSSLALLGLNISTQSGPLFYQSLAWTPLDWNLMRATETFFYVGLLQLTLIAAHFAYTKLGFLARLRSGVTARALTPLHLFEQPTSIQLLAMGCAGTFALWFSATHSVGYGDALEKMLLAMMPFAYAPFLAPFIVKKSVDPQNPRIPLWPYAAYLAILFLVSIEKNSRAAFAIGFITVVLVAYLLHVAGEIRLTKRIVRRVMIIGIPALLAFGAISDLSVAMVAARQYQYTSQASGIKLVKLTADELFDPEELDYWRNSQNLWSADYNETYISNVLFARLITIKFDDNMTYFASQLDEAQANEVRNVTWNKLIAILPTPVIHLFAPAFNKHDVEFTTGDYIFYLARGYGLYYSKLGSITAHGRLIMGNYFYLLMFVCALIAFPIIDSFARISNGGMAYSPLILLMSYRVFGLFGGDSVINFADAMLREIPQMVLLYWVLMKLMSMFSRHPHTPEISVGVKK